jgi:preprotein translocase subunit SecG
MSVMVDTEDVPVARSRWIWLIPLQGAVGFTILAVAAGGQVLRTWLLTAAVWLMTIPLFLGLEAGLIAMMLFEPVRGIARRAQYLFVDYAAQDPIHLLTPIVTLVAFILLLRSRRLEILIATPLAGAVSVLAFIYVLEIFNPLQGGILIGLSGGLFMLVPLVWFYFGQAVDETFMRKALGVVIVLALLTSAYGVYQLLWGYPAFEQYWIDNTDFYASINVAHIRRALATFSSAEEWARYAEVAAIAAFGFIAGSKGILRRGAWLVCSVALVGAVLLTGERTAIFGLMAGISALILVGARTIPSVLARVAMLLVPVVLILAFVSPPSEDDMWSKSDKETVSTLLSHAQRGTLKPAEEESFQIRLENWTHLLTSVIPYRPLGAGLGSGSLAELRFSSESDLPPIDSFILVVAIACGIPGALLFSWIIGRAGWFSIQNARAPGEPGDVCIRRIVAALMPALILNSVFGLTFTLYSVAPIGWLLIGWISRETKRIREANEREVIII